MYVNDNIRVNIADKVRQKPHLDLNLTILATHVL